METKVSFFFKIHDVEKHEQNHLFCFSTYHIHRNFHSKKFDFPPEVSRVKIDQKSTFSTKISVLENSYIFGLLVSLICKLQCSTKYALILIASHLVLIKKKYYNDRPINE